MGEPEIPEGWGRAQDLWEVVEKYLSPDLPLALKQAMERDCFATFERVLRGPPEGEGLELSQELGVWPPDVLTIELFRARGHRKESFFATVRSLMKQVVMPLMVEITLLRLELAELKARDAGDGFDEEEGK